jgi:hypothetical protein
MPSPRDEPVYATIGNSTASSGHQAILASVINAARSRSAPSLLISFDPHPLAVVAPSRGPKLLQTRRQKLEAIEATGVDGMLLLPFDRELAALTGEEFFEAYLAERIRFAGVHVGSTFRFGHARGGDIRPRDNRSQARILGTGGSPRNHRRRDGLFVGHTRGDRRGRCRPGQGDAGPAVRRDRRGRAR